MESMPLISVIVPVYNVEKYLDQCITSIVDQTYKNLEIILVDDGSPDGSGAMCDAWAQKDNRIRVIHQPNAGSGAARNAALDVASGDLIAFVDSDDYLCKDTYMHLFSLLSDDVDIAECGYVETFDDDTSFGVSDDEVCVFSVVDAMHEHIWGNAFQQLIWNKLYRREMVEGVRFPVDKKIDDEFFTYRVLAKARKLVRSSNAYYAYRQQQDSIMHQPFSIKRLQGLEAKLQRVEFLKKNMTTLVQDAKLELFYSCMLYMRASIRYLQGEEQKNAKKLIHKILDDIAPVSPGSGISMKKKVFLKMAQMDFMGTCRLLNFLTDIHVLS